MPLCAQCSPLSPLHLLEATRAPQHLPPPCVHPRHAAARARVRRHHCHGQRGAPPHPLPVCHRIAPYSHRDAANGKLSHSPAPSLRYVHDEPVLAHKKAAEPRHFSTLSRNHHSTPLIPVHRQKGGNAAAEALLPCRALHLAGAEGGRRSRPSRAALPPSFLCTPFASPLTPHSPAAICPCIIHSRAAEDSPELNHGRGGGDDHAADDWSRPSTRNSPQSFPSPSAVDSDHLRHLPSSQVSESSPPPSPEPRRRQEKVAAVP